MFSHLIRMDVTGLIAGELLAESFDVLVTKGDLKPDQILMMNIVSIITYSAGPEYLILKELVLKSFVDMIQSG